MKNAPVIRQGYICGILLTCVLCIVRNWGVDARVLVRGSAGRGAFTHLKDVYLPMKSSNDHRTRRLPP